MKVRVPSPLFSYTGNRAEVAADGATLGAVLADLDRQFQGLRFRVIDEQDKIRPHIKMFVAGKLATSLDAAVGSAEEVMIVAALSGG